MVENQRSIFLALLNGQAGKPSHDIVREFWQAQLTGVQHFDAFWEKTLCDGVMADTAFPPKQVSLKSGIGAQASPSAQQGPGDYFPSRPGHLGRPVCK